MFKLPLKSSSSQLARYALGGLFLLSSASALADTGKVTLKQCSEEEANKLRWLEVLKCPNNGYTTYAYLQGRKPETDKKYGWIYYIICDGNVDTYSLKEGQPACFRMKGDVGWIYYRPIQNP